MSRVLIRWVWFTASLALSTGCSDQSSSVPQFDRSGSRSYGASDFKDDAPANASVAISGFPLSFVDCHGATVDLTRFRGKKVVLVVLRGIPQSQAEAFCPSCIAQTGSLMVNRQEFVNRSVEILVLFPGPTDRLGEFLQTARKHTPGEPEWHFRILLDQDCSACTQLGIRDDLAKPSTYILDTQGNVVYAYVGETSTDRPSVKAILAQLDKAE
jgi:peroxiredoxin